MNTEITPEEIEAVAKAMWESTSECIKWHKLDPVADASLKRELRRQAKAGLKAFVALRNGGKDEA